MFDEQILKHMLLATTMADKRAKNAGVLVTCWYVVCVDFFWTGKVA